MTGWRQIFSALSVRVERDYRPDERMQIPRADIDSFHILLRRSNTYTIVLSDEGRDVGFLQFAAYDQKESKDLQEVYVLSVYLLSEYRGKGWGQYLQRAFISHLNERYGDGDYIIMTDIETDAGSKQEQYRRQLLQHPELSVVRRDNRKLSWKVVPDEPDVSDVPVVDYLVVVESDIYPFATHITDPEQIIMELEDPEGPECAIVFTDGSDELTSDMGGVVVRVGNQLVTVMPD